MKKLVKYSILGLLIWEFVSLYYKDKEFQKDFDSSAWLDKAKVAVNWLVDLNKKLLQDASGFDYKSFFEEKINLLEEKVEDLKESADILNEEKIKPLIADLNENYTNIKSHLEEVGGIAKDQYQKQMKNIKKWIDNIKEKAKKSRKA